MSRTRAVRQMMVRMIIIMAVVSTATLVLGLGAGLMLVPNQVSRPSGATRLFYVVIYHWGFAFYNVTGPVEPPSVVNIWDVNAVEVPAIEVNQGDTVVLYVIASTSLRDDIRLKLEGRTIQRGIGDLPSSDPRIREKIDEAIGKGLTTFGLGIQYHEISVQVSGNSTNLNDVIKVVRFKAFKAGRFDIVNPIYDGYGYYYHAVPGGFVVKANASSPAA